MKAAGLLRHHWQQLRSHWPNASNQHDVAEFAMHVAILRGPKYPRAEVLSPKYRTWNGSWNLIYIPSHLLPCTLWDTARYFAISRVPLTTRHPCAGARTAEAGDRAAQRREPVARRGEEASQPVLNVHDMSDISHY